MHILATTMPVENGLRGRAGRGATPRRGSGGAAARRRRAQPIAVICLYALYWSAAEGAACSRYIALRRRTEYLAGVECSHTWQLLFWHTAPFSDSSLYMLVEVSSSTSVVLYDFNVV